MRDTTKPEEDTRYVLKHLKNLKRIGRMRNEVEAGLKLEHQNVVRVVHWNLESTEPYIVTDYYPGGSLSEARPFEYGYGHLFNLMGQICDGVLHAHSKGVKHRDLKPDNIFLSTDRKGHAVVGDFGLCLIDEGERVTLTEEAVGARYYMAPELEDGRTDQVSEASDVYSLGKLLYWLISGGRVFSREEKHRTEDFNLITITKEPWMEHVNRLLDHMIVADPDNRWPLGVVRDEVVLTKRLVVGEYNPVGPDVQTRCYYCGIGGYMLIGRDRASLEKDNFISAGQPDAWRVLVCNFCGHVQRFRPDIGGRLSPMRTTPWETPPKELPPATHPYPL